MNYIISIIMFIVMIFSLLAIRDNHQEIKHLQQLEQKVEQLRKEHDILKKHNLGIGIGKRKGT